jgi:phosphate transport system substrate-binding protein
MPGKQFLRTVAALSLLVAAVPAPSEVLVNGAGASFPYPIYAKWIDEFQRVHPDARINYQSVGSGAGIRLLQTGTVDFGASDRPLTDEQLRASPVKILHFPTVVGAAVPIYNVAGLRKPLRFSPAALAGIFLGTIRKWNDAALADENAGAALPDAEIVVVHRSDGSGTTFVWTEFLSKTSAAWNRRVGAGTAVNWPVGLGARGNEGVTAVVKQTPNSFGYVELAYALQNHLPYGAVRNRAGAFVRADAGSMAAAALEASARMPDDFRVSITNAPGKRAYPIATFTWLLLPARIADANKRATIVSFLRWMLENGQKEAEPLGYAPLPVPVVARALAAIGRIQ